MKLSAIINEDRSTEIKHTAEAIDLLNAHCPKNYAYIKKTDNFLFRGKRNSGKPLFQIDSTNDERQSAHNFHNFYTLYLSYDSDWQKFPPRNKAIITTNKFSQAAAYGTVYIIVPFDNTKIAICPTGDIFDAFNNQLKEHHMGDMINLFFAVVLKIFEFVGFPYVKSFYVGEQGYQKMMEGMRKISAYSTLAKEQIRRELRHNVEFLIFDKLIQPDFVETTFREIMNPKLNNFKLATYPNIKEWELAREMWFVGQAIGVATYGHLLQDIFGYNKILL